MDDPANILVVDDDEETVTLLREILSKEGYNVDTAADGKIALDKIGSRPPDLVISDIHMPDLDGMSLLAELRVRFPDVPVILMTAYGSLKTAVDGLRSGAFDYLSKPFIVDDIRLVVRRALEHKNLSRQNQALKEQLRHRYRFDNLVGSSPGIVSVYKSIARVANTESTVLLQGESGTGKVRTRRGRSPAGLLQHVPPPGARAPRAGVIEEPAGHQVPLPRLGLPARRHARSRTPLR